MYINASHRIQVYFGSRYNHSNVYHFNVARERESRAESTAHIVTCQPSAYNLHPICWSSWRHTAAVHQKNQPNRSNHGAKRQERANTHTQESKKGEAEEEKEEKNDYLLFQLATQHHSHELCTWCAPSNYFSCVPCAVFLALHRARAFSYISAGVWSVCVIRLMEILILAGVCVHVHSPNEHPDHPRPKTQHTSVFVTLPCNQCVHKNVNVFFFAFLLLFSLYFGVGGGFVYYLYFIHVTLYRIVRSKCCVVRRRWRRWRWCHSSAQRYMYLYNLVT